MKNEWENIQGCPACSATGKCGFHSFRGEPLIHNNARSTASRFDLRGFACLVSEEEDERDMPSFRGVSCHACNH